MQPEDDTIPVEALSTPSKYTTALANIYNKTKCIKCVVQIKRSYYTIKFKINIYFDKITINLIRTYMKYFLFFLFITIFQGCFSVINTVNKSDYKGKVSYQKQEKTMPKKIVD